LGEKLGDRRHIRDSLFAAGRGQHIWSGNIAPSEDEVIFTQRGEHSAIDMTTRDTHAYEKWLRWHIRTQQPRVINPIFYTFQSSISLAVINDVSSHVGLLWKK
jgi:hypothetical protein